MVEIFLGGALTITSLAAPTAEDEAKLATLSLEQRLQVLREAIAAGEASGVSARNAEDIIAAAKARALTRADHDS